MIVLSWLEICPGQRYGGGLNKQGFTKVCKELQDCLRKNKEPMAASRVLIMDYF